MSGEEGQEGGREVGVENGGVWSDSGESTGHECHHKTSECVTQVMHQSSNR